MLKTGWITVLFAVVGLLFSLACFGEKDNESKTVYAGTAIVMFVLLFASMICERCMGA